MFKVGNNLCEAIKLERQRKIDVSWKLKGQRVETQFLGIVEETSPGDTEESTEIHA